MMEREEKTGRRTRSTWGQFLSVLSVLPVLSVFFILPSCFNDDRSPVVLYSPHGRDQLTLLEHAFERHRPDVDIRWLDMGSQEILDRLRFERVNPQADVWFGGPSPIFERGIEDSLLQPYRPSWASSVDLKAVGPNELYFPVYRTPAVIAFNSRAVLGPKLPGTGTKCWSPVGRTR
jgi:iron(III) transport system substrate-binding protein